MIKLTFGDEVASWAYGNTVFDHYPAGEPLLKLDDGKLKDLYRVTVRSASITELMYALFTVDAARERGCKEVELILPYVPGARQDRLNDEGDQLFTLKSVASEINHRNFSNVFVLDPHSDVTTALIDRCQVLPLINSTTYSKLKTNQYDGVIIPDAGASKRATKIASMLSVPTFQAWKKRDIMTGKLSGFGIEPLVGGKSYLIVDDICDGGGTFTGLAAHIADCALQTWGQPFLDLYVSHGLFTQGVKELHKHFQTIYTTDSLPQIHDGKRFQVFSRF